MTTKIIIPIQDSNEIGSKSVYVEDTYDEVLGKVQPLTQPSSALEHRMMFEYTLPDGRRCWIPPSNIVYVEENVEPPA